MDDLLFPNPQYTPTEGRNKINTIMTRFSISYFKGAEFKYVDSRMFETANNASVRAVLHITNHIDDVDGAAIIRQGKAKSTRVFTLKIWSNEKDK